MAKVRKNSFAFGGGAFGDEGKGRVVDKFVSDFAKKKPVVVYRDNGGSNAGHTVEFESGERLALHQLPSGVFVPKAIVLLGRGMVLHPADLLAEISQVESIMGEEVKNRVQIDEMAVLSLDTHRAFEAVLKQWQEGGRGATGRGIAPAYADILLRHPLRASDLVSFDKEKFRAHFRFYAALISGLGEKLESLLVPRLTGEKVLVGTEKEFLDRLKEESSHLAPYIGETFEKLKKNWVDEKVVFVFEKAQGVGLDARYGVYPDVTASDVTFRGIFSSTEGIVSPEEIAVRAAVIKATYMSSVGSRNLPTEMEESLASRIREDAHEYGATTKRPRGIAYLDLPALKFFARVGEVNALVLTHLDIVYPGVPIKVCTAYKIDGQEVSYRPYQSFLDKVRPQYIELPSWDCRKVSQAKTREELPQEALNFLDFISRELGLPIVMVTTGPKREQAILFNP